MPMTPADVQAKQFKVAFRGYSLDEVDAFLDEVESEIGRLLRENDALRSGSTAARAVAAPQVASGPIDPMEGQEAALRTLLLAQRTAEEAVAEARAEAEQIVGAARADADAATGAARAELERARTHAAASLGDLDAGRARLEQQIEDLRAFEREYRTRLRAFLQAQLHDLEDPHAPEGTGAGVPVGAPAQAAGPGPGDPVVGGVPAAGGS